MALQKRVYKDGETVITAENLNAIQDEIIRHGNDKSNPHGVTPAQIGAAPAGYGLGTGAWQIGDNEDIDNIVGNGWYAFSQQNTSPNKPFATGELLTLTKNLNYRTQIAVLSYHPTSIVIRQMTGGVWQPWEYINPPIELGRDYRTTERWQGKAVYTKIVNCGKFPTEGAKNHTHFSTHTTQIIRVNAIGSSGFAVPYTATDAKVYVSATIYEGTAQIVVYVEMGDLTDKDCYAQVWYTKD
jgi:hypothetical protein